MSAPSQDTPATNGTTRFENRKDLLEYLYTDLTRFSTIVSADIILHPFDAPADSIKGIAAVQAWEESLVAATDGTLNMEVTSISVSGDDYAQVNGVLRAHKPGREELAVRFEGRWRFAGGVPVEHWEKVVDDAEGAVGWFEDAGWKRPGSRKC